MSVLTIRKLRGEDMTDTKVRDYDSAVTALNKFIESCDRDTTTRYDFFMAGWNAYAAAKEEHDTLTAQVVELKGEVEFQNECRNQNLDAFHQSQKRVKYLEGEVQAERVRIAGHLEDAIYLADKNPYEADSAVDELRGLLKELKGESQ
jgi:hypothetical protein